MSGPREAVAQSFDHSLDDGRHKEMLWTGDPMTAQEAKELGLVSSIVPREKLEEEMLALARRIALSSPVVVGLVRRLIDFAQDEIGQRNACQYHMLIRQLFHASDETRRWRKERAKAMQQGGLKEMLKVTDSKFAQ